jgi:hypothetical protein
MKYQVELSIVGACGGYSKTPAKHAPAVGNSVLNSPINNLGSGSFPDHIADQIPRFREQALWRSARMAC